MHIRADNSIMLKFSGELIYSFDSWFWRVPEASRVRLGE